MASLGPALAGLFGLSHRLSMPHPDADGGELDRDEEVVVALVIAGGDGAQMICPSSDQLGQLAEGWPRLRVAV